MMDDTPWAELESAACVGKYSDWGEKNHKTKNKFFDLIEHILYGVQESQQAQDLYIS